MAKQDTASGANAPGKIGGLIEYFTEARGELKKVTWPAKKELKIAGIAVIVLVVAMSVLLSVADLVLSKVVQLILS